MTAAAGAASAYGAVAPAMRWRVQRRRREGSGTSLSATDTGPASVARRLTAYPPVRILVIAFEALVVADFTDLWPVKIDTSMF